MANHLGREGLIKISSTTIGELKNYAITHTSDTVDDSVIGDVYRTRQGAMKTWAASGEVHWDETDAGQLLITIGSTVTLVLYPEGNQTTDVYYSGSAIVTKFDVSASFDGLVMGQIAFEGNGVLSTLTL